MKKYLIAVCLVFIGCNKNESSPTAVEAKSDPIAEAIKMPNFNNEISAGLHLSNQGKFEDAIAYFEKALQRSPGAPVALNNICYQQVMLKKWLPAIENCKAAIKGAPDFNLPKNNLNLAEKGLSDQLTQIKSLEAEVNALEGNNKRLRQIDLGFEYYKMGNYNESIKIWTKIPLKKDPTSAIVLNNLGASYILTKKYSEARKALSEAIKIEPNNQLAKSNFAWLETQETKK